MAKSADLDQLASSKPTDLDLHSLQRQCISGFNRTQGLKNFESNTCNSFAISVLRVKE